MLRRRSSVLVRSAWCLAGSALAPLLVAYLYVGSCGGGKSGIVFAFRAGKVVVTAAWCEAPRAEPRS
jgi:hypothetical protein